MKATYKSENDVKSDVKELLDKHGWFHWPNSAGPYSVSGISDRTGLKQGVYIAVECKFGANTPTGPQGRFLDGVNAQGGVGGVVNEWNILAFAHWLTRFDADMSEAVGLFRANGNDW